MAELYIMPDSDALDQAMQMDREYFEQHPDKSDYFRLAVPGEDFGYFPPKTLVHVVNFSEGTRQRSFYLPPQEIWADLEREGKASQPAHSDMQNVNGDAKWNYH